MTTLERLKEAVKMQQERWGEQTVMPVKASELGKLLAVVEAAQAIEENPCTSEQIHALWNALDLMR